MPIRRRFVVALVALAMLLLAAPVIAMLREPVAVDLPMLEPTSATVAMRGLPALTAPGGSIALHWVVEGSPEVDRTSVFWDTVSRATDKNYRYRTPFQVNRPAGGFFEYIDVPSAAQTIYIRPYAVVDDEIVWGAREHKVYTRLGLNTGSHSIWQDTSGEWWANDPDGGIIHQWYGFDGGTRHQVTAPIAGTTDDGLYQSQRVGVSAFGCYLSAGSAQTEILAEFHLAELSATAPGARVFDIYLEKGTPNEVAIRDIDVAAQVGTYHALVITGTVTVADDQLDITFVGQGGSAPILNGLLLRGLSGMPLRQATQRIVTSDDDTFVEGTANRRDSATVNLDGGGVYHGGLRFNHLQIPQGSTIHHAQVRVTAAEDSYWRMKLHIYADNVGQSPSFREGPLVTVRPRTTAYTVWDVPTSEVWRTGREYGSPDLASVIQEIVNRPDWQWHNALSLLLIGQGGDSTPRRVHAIDGSYQHRAMLVVDFSPPHVWPATPAATLTYTPTPSRTPTPTVTATPTHTATASPSPTATITPTATATATATSTPTLPPHYLPLLFHPFFTR